MILTNETNLPEPLFRAVENDDYNPGDCDISVTQLISPPQQVSLIRKHYKTLTQDASERIFMLLGKTVHVILERAAINDIAERRMFRSIGGWIISGQMDLWQSRKMIMDYKVTSVWVARDGLRKEWEQQLNIYRWLAAGQDNPLPVEALQIVAIYRDWSKREARRNGEYPRHQVGMFNVPIWTDGAVEEFIRQRIELHQIARLALSDDNPDGSIALPPCTEEDRWAKPTKYAAMKNTNKRALKLCDTKEEALAVPGCTHTEVRLGEQIRCEDYCLARDVCPQYKGTLAQLDPNDTPA